MRLIDYVKDRVLFLLINSILYLITVLVLVTVNMNLIIALVLFLIWFGPLSIYILLEFFKTKKYYDEVQSINENLDQKYLLAEVIEEPAYIEQKIMYEIIKESHRNMQEYAKYYKMLQTEYQEYMETWIHEIKTPIASTMLIIENHEDNIPPSMKYQIKKIEDFVEQVLYYSRSNNVNQDYIVKPFNLETSIKTVIKKNSSDFIHKRISLKLEHIDEEIFSDPKWVEFILNQIIGNSIKYAKETDGKITISATRNEHNILLTIQDNGVGITEKDVERVFDKGFTGENGRRFGKSTGIGLYLCKKLCDKLGLRITLTSIQDVGTTVDIIFPIGQTSLIKKR